MKTLAELCPRGKFYSIWEYDDFIKQIDALVGLDEVVRIKPNDVSEWDFGADFFFYRKTNEIFKLHHPDAPFQGAWEKVLPRPIFIEVKP